MDAYPVTLTPASNFAPDETGFVVTFPDVPEAITEGEDEADALLRAVDALESAMMAYIEDRRDLPKPSPAEGRPVVSVGTEAAMKLAVYQAMRAAGLRKADLARRLGWHGPQIDRLLDLRHASRVDQIDAALAALGKRLVVTLDAA